MLSGDTAGREGQLESVACFSGDNLDFSLCAGGFFTMSAEFLAMLTSKPWEGLSRIPSLHHFISLFGNQAIFLGLLCVFSCSCGVE